MNTKQKDISMSYYWLILTMLLKCRTAAKHKEIYRIDIKTMNGKSTYHSFWEIITIDWVNKTAIDIVPFFSFLKIDKNILINFEYHPVT
jgi:hypothetical protein